VTIKPDIDTDFSQFEDAAAYHDRRSNDGVECPKDDCPAVFVLERRVDRHRQEIEELKTMVTANGKLVEKNSADTSEILEIVTLAKSFFKVLGWIGDKLKTIMALVGAVGAVAAWFKYKS
jgi:hypothetical protein